jgi:hypothetical protein
VAAGLGLVLAFPYLRGTRTRGQLPAIVHGSCGAAGFCFLVAALQGPRRGDAMGVGSFGVAASVLFGIALAIGPVVPLLRGRSPRGAGTILGVHASVAITGLVLFLAWASLN